MTVIALEHQEPELAGRFTRDVTPLLEVLSRGARRLARTDADAEDLLQDTLLRAYSGFGSFQEGTNLQAWLFRILYNQWVNIHRSRQCRPTEVSDDEANARELARVSAGQRSAETEALAALPDTEIRCVLASLPEGFGEVVYYVFVEGYTYAETAVLLDIPVGTVMSRISRARQRLRLALAHRAPTRRADTAAAQRIA
ncbi:RNA polymerase sigma factor, sigma-70 family [Mycolicibacterium chubuense NBB4]|uniref:RNA polymerase sigma factor n=1 Tax=Mycolicibacterium chubuense (strain NBB4) TaxID=710421 RepID=I4BRF2_MYCCN|nr:sigma-70 family RNA polymerase sigma factor [Mycolicibacterium chubuense]AFM19859.1 RNA polymerase sigma factor, sigma-70 family [Mycolicibacterium chubuense NBB4]